MKKLLLFFQFLLITTTTIYSQGFSSDIESVTAGFLPNLGQLVDNEGNYREDILFSTRSNNMNVFIGKTGVHYQFVKSPNGRRGISKGEYDHHVSTKDSGQTVKELYRIDVKLIGAKPNPKVRKLKPTGYKENYYLDHCPEGITGVEGYDKVILKDVYPGIDWVFYRNDRHLKYDFIVRPGADYRQIKMRISGADKITLRKDGAIKVTCPFGSIIESAPVCFADGRKVESNFVLDEDQLSFEMSEYPKNKILRIDPILEWVNLYGGNGDEIGRHCAADNSGNVYLVGQTESTMGIASGGHQNTINSAVDAFLVKFDSTGNRLWATYYGGGQDDYATGCAVDANGNVFISGTTESTSSIASNGHSNIYKGGRDDAFLAKFDSAGVRQWATYRGSSIGDEGYSCTTDGSDVYLTTSLGGDACISKYNAAGTMLWYSCESGNLSYLKSVRDCAVDPMGNVFIAVTWLSPQFSDEGHLVKYSSSGSQLWQKNLGGNNDVSAYSCATDKSGYVYVTGLTHSSNGIATSNAHQSSYGGAGDAFLVKYDSTGTKVWGTYLGSNQTDYGRECVVDASDNIYLCGHTPGTSNIAFNGAQVTNMGGADAFLSKFNSSGQMEWSTYHGGYSYEEGYSCAISADDAVFLAGTEVQFGQTSGQAYVAKYDGCLPSGVISASACYNYTWQLDGNTYTSSGSYPYIISNFNGCDSSVVLDLTINDTAYATMYDSACNSYYWPLNANTYTNSGKYQINLVSSHGCDSIVTLDLTIVDTFGIEKVTSCNSYYWPIDSNTYYQSGVYSDTVVNSLGCDSVVELDLSIVQLDTTIIRSGATLISNEDSSLYQWYLCNPAFIKINGATQKEFTPPTNGSYALVVKSGNCVDTSSCYSVSNVGVVDEYLESKVKYFPNPLQESINIELDKRYSEVILTTYNQSGKKIFTKVYTNKKRINSEMNVAPGVYLIELKYDEIIDFFKIIKQ